MEEDKEVGSEHKGSRTHNCMMQAKAGEGRHELLNFLISISSSTKDQGKLIAKSKVFFF